MDRTFLRQRIEAVKAQIVDWEGVLDFFAQNNGVQSYTLNTNQSVQTVSRSQIASIRLLLDGLYNRLSTLEARVYGRTLTARPAF